MKKVVYTKVLPMSMVYPELVFPGGAKNLVKNARPKLTLTLQPVAKVDKVQ